MTANSFYNPSGSPATSSAGASAIMRSEFIAIGAAFGLLPTLSGNGSKAVIVNAAGTALTVTTGTLALAGNLATTGAFNTTLAQTASTTLTLPAVSGTLATLAGTETLSNKTLVAPALGTPASGVLTNCTGTASGLTAGNVTTNANLIGPITSVGNTTAVAAQTGTGSTFVMNTSPTLVTPNIGVATATSLTIGAVTSTGVTGTGNIVFSIAPTLTGHVTIEGVTSAGATGSGNLVFATTPTLTTLTVSSGGAAITGNTSISGGSFTASPASANVVFSPTGTGVVTISPSTAGTMNNMVIGGVTPLAGTFTTVADAAGNLRSIQQSGSDYSSNHILTTSDLGQNVGLIAGGSVEVPDGIFANGNAITVINKTGVAKTITGTITTMYRVGTDTDQATLSLAARGVCTIVFTSGTVCYVAGTVN